MKKTLLLTLALGLAGATSYAAGTVEVFITGSTAFRASCYTACQALFVGGAPSTYFGDAAHGGADSGWGSGTASWAMTGTPVSTLTNLSGSTLIVHGLFTGSIQGIQTVESKTKLVFAKAAGTAGQLTSGYVTNTPTIGFSDSASTACPFRADLFNCNEESVAVQPFVIAKSTASGMNVISNATYEQIRSAIVPGRLPLSVWTGNLNDTNTFIYVPQRTSDSGTRRTETACVGYTFQDTVGIYIWNETNKVWYPGTNSTTVASSGNGTNGIVGPAGLNNVNTTWGAGYVGGGDLRDHALKDSSANNLSLGCLSFADSRTLGASQWGTVISFNGMWPTASGIGLRGNTGTNDFSPITSGFYPLWAEEVIVYPTDIDNFGSGDNKITTFQLGSKNDPGSFVWVFNYQTKNPGNSSTPLLGSIEKTIEDSKTAVNGASAIRLSDMRVSRSDVGGLIAPF
jgi:hypothetical protein